MPYDNVPLPSHTQWENISPPKNYLHRAFSVFIFNEVRLSLSLSHSLTPLFRELTRFTSFVLYLDLHLYLYLHLRLHLG